MPKVYIDPGHGGEDSGAPGNGYFEKDIVLEVAKILNDKLNNIPNFETRMSRTDDTFKSLSFRSNDSNNWGSDIFVSIHANSSENLKAKGVETYAFAEQYRHLADCVQKGLLSVNLPYNDRGVKFENWHVVRETKCNACLTEIGFISNSEDINILLQYDIIADGILKGILEYFKISYSEQPSNNLYYVFTNCYKIKSNAEQEIKELKAKGIQAYIKEV